MISNSKMIKVSETIPQDDDDYISGGSAIRYLIEEHEAEMLEVMFWLRDHFTAYLQGEYGEWILAKISLKSYNPYAYFYKKQQVLDFTPTNEIRLIDIERVILDPKGAFGKFSQTEVLYIIQKEINNNTLKVIRGIDIRNHNYTAEMCRSLINILGESLRFSIDPRIDETPFLIKADVERLAEKYLEPCMELQNIKLMKQFT